jgi:sugar/nucleoside kinase (ribokinase family)
MTQHARIVCIGNLTIDHLFLPNGSNRPECVGGDAFYAGLAARLWEPRTSILAPVGSDLPDSTLQSIRDAGFDADALPRRGGRTIRNQVHYALDGARRWVLETSEETFQELSVVPPDIPDWVLAADAILVSAMTLEAQEACINYLRQASTAILVLDLREGYIHGNEQRILDLVAQADLFLPSEVEANLLADRSDWENLAKWYANIGPRVVAIKFADKGSLVYRRDTQSLTRIPARKTPVRDSTGAGDAYCGGFVANYIHDPEDLDRAGRAGAVSAAIAVSGYGTRALAETDAEVARQALDDDDGWLPTPQL